VAKCVEKCAAGSSEDATLLLSLVPAAETLCRTERHKNNGKIETSFGTATESKTKQRCCQTRLPWSTARHLLEFESLSIEREELYGTKLRPG